MNYTEEGAVTSLLAEVPASEGDPKRNQDGQMRGNQVASDRGALAKPEGELLVWSVQMNHPNCEDGSQLGSEVLAARLSMSLWSCFAF